MNPSVDLVLNWDPREAVRISRILTLPQFEFGDALLGNCDTHMYGEIFSCINASFVLNRRSGYFIINIYIPTVLIVSMSMLTFWIPPEAVPARITLGVTSLLTIITKQYQSNMPNVSYVVALNIWLSCCIAFVFCSLLEYALVITLVKRKQMEVKPVIHHQTNKEVGCGGSERKSQISAWIGNHCQIFKDSPHLIDMGSKFLFPIAFIIFCIAYGGRYSM
ncbi:glycine receptor subunit alphaZ1-like [Stegodyphus dumicola]|uniref:glycine receptor subunit alphaZ1-like n=1 Tax=Stegodyphus dumicola TaxID=202533 RepID=UPI0015AAB847|nr:glycine receptor subunit alphaZ1-like [Stegodyphus dumicola]